MTRDEFIDGYCKKSGITREFFFENGDAVPCDCGEDGCAGWQYDTSRSQARDGLSGYREEAGVIYASEDVIHLTGSAEAAPSLPDSVGRVYFFQDAVDAGNLRFTMSNKPVVCFKPDGTIEMGEGYTPTEAAEAFIAILRDALPGHMQKTREALDYANRKLEVYGARIAALEGGIAAENERTSVIERELQAVKDLLVGRDEDFHPTGAATVAEVVERILGERSLLAEALEVARNPKHPDAVAWMKHLEGCDVLPGGTYAPVFLSSVSRLFTERDAAVAKLAKTEAVVEAARRLAADRAKPSPEADCECLDWTQVGHPASAYWPDMHPNYHHPDCAKYVAPLTCEGCGARASHAEHFYDRVRAWCEAHVPWSGHHEYCGDACRVLLNAGKC